jgi:hypothetical protein
MNMNPAPSARRRISRALTLCLLAVACFAQASCSWLTGEFATLDPMPKSCRPQAFDADALGSASRP